MGEGSERDPGGPPGDAGGRDDPSGSDTELERRLHADEQRIIGDEIRLARDEERIAQDERWIRRNWRLALALSALLALTIVALVISIMALNRDIDAAAAAAPKDASVGTAALRDGAVTRAKIAPAAVGGSVVADGGLTARMVAANTLTGAQIQESTLGTVPRATRADAATTAGDASRLGDVAAAQYLRGLTVARAESQTSTLAVKGPVTASCPAGTTVIAGGVAIDGAAQVAITTSAPDGTAGWIGEAAALGTGSSPWKISVTAICASGG